MSPLVSTALAAAIAFSIGSVLGFAALAQDAGPGLDLAAIRARAAQNAADAEALAATARSRATAMTAPAQETASEGEANGQRFTDAVQHVLPARVPSVTPFDFDRLIADAGNKARADLGTAPRFVAFGSTSMPRDSLRAMVRDVTRAGGVVVLRGLPGGSVAGLTNALREVLEPGQKLDGLGIDPRLFRAFHVEAVPTYVMAASDFDLCSGFDCTDTVPPHDRLAGNVTAQFALETFAGGGGPGARLAALHLARLGGGAR